MNNRPFKDNVLTVMEIANELGVPRSDVYNWINYFRYLKANKFMGLTYVWREDYDQFKSEHADVIEGAQQKLAAA